MQGTLKAPSKANSLRIFHVFLVCLVVWSIFKFFGFKIEFLTKLINYSAWFCMEKLKKYGFETKKLKHKTTKPKIKLNTKIRIFNLGVA